MSNQKDLIISALEFYRDQSAKFKPVSGDDLINHIIEKGIINKGDSDMALYVKRLHLQIHDKSWGDERGFISLDAYLGLIDYEELQQARLDSAEARREALNAMKIAKWSLFVGIGVGIVQILLALFQA